MRSMHLAWPLGRVVIWGGGSRKRWPAAVVSSGGVLDPSSEREGGRSP